MPNPFVHIELQTTDLPKAKEFYSQLFNWQLQDIPMSGGDGCYTMIDVGGGTGGGMFASPDPKVPARWLAYVGVEDVCGMSDKARQLGATVCVDGVEVGTFGLMSVLVDPAGASFALWQCKNPPPQT